MKPAGGGWAHDMLNDELYAEMLGHAKAGRYDAIMCAFPCSTGSIARFFFDRPTPTRPLSPQTCPVNHITASKIAG